MRRKAVIVAVPVIVLLMLVTVSVAFIWKADNRDRDRKDIALVIDSDKEIIHRNEVFNLTVSNVPEDANVTWIWGDGNVSFGRTCGHRYQISDIYNVTAAAVWDGGSGEGSLDVYACNEDVHFETRGDGFFNIRLLTYSYTFSGEMMFFSCNLGDPLLVFDMQIADVVGLISIDLILWKHEGNGAFGHSILSEDYTELNNDVSIHQEFDDLEIEPWPEPYSLEVFIQVNEGRIGSYEIIMEAIYPVPLILTQ